MTELFTDVCTVQADTSKATESLRPKLGPDGFYYSLSFDIILLFGLTELKAQISWMENVSNSLPAASSRISSY